MRYYSTRRPLGPGTYPRQDGGETITIFGSPVYCEEIGREAWGYIDYKEPITPEQAACYELIPGTSTWYPITVSSRKHGGGLRAFSGRIVKAAQRPEDKDGDTKNMQFKTRYFHTWQEAQRIKNRNSDFHYRFCRHSDLGKRTIYSHYY